MSSMNYPKIVRTRGYKLHDLHGKQYIDLWLADGDALLGHTIPHYTRAIKSTLSRGLFAPYPSIYQGRVEKLLLELFPDFPYVVYLPKEISLVDAIQRVATEQSLNPTITDMAFQTPPYKDILLWRPFANKEQSGAGSIDSEYFGAVQLIIPKLPVVSDVFPKLILARSPISSITSSMQSPFVYDGMVKVLAHLRSALQSVYRMPTPLESAIDRLGWQRIGPYVHTPFSQVVYESFVKSGLERGFFLPPNQETPLILPRELSSGEQAKLIGFLESSVQ